jgi:hypothetical protein
MFDVEKLKPEELAILATYILPREYTATDMFDQMCADLAPLGIRKLKGTIGALKGRFYNDYFLRSPYWKIVSRHYRKLAICPVCKKYKTLVIYSPAFHHMGVSHLHPEDNFLACGDCHQVMNQFAREWRFWKTQKDEDDVRQFLNQLEEAD